MFLLDMRWYMKDVVVFFNFPRGSNKSYNNFFFLLIIGVFAKFSQISIKIFFWNSKFLRKHRSAFSENEIWSSENGVWNSEIEFQNSNFFFQNSEIEISENFANMNGVFAKIPENSISEKLSLKLQNLFANTKLFL